MKILLIVLLIAITVPQVDAKSKVEVCKSGYVGYEYKPELDVKCKGLYKLWNKQMFKSFNKKII